MFNKQRGPRQARPVSAKPSMNYYRSRTPATPVKSSQKSVGLFRNLLKRAGDTAIIIALLAVVIYSLMVRPQPQVKVDSQAYRPAADYQRLITDELRSLKNRNKVTFDEPGLLRSLQAKYPEVSTIAARLPLFSQTPHISLSISPPIIRLVNGSESYIVDSDGLVVGRQSAFGKLGKLPAVRDRSGFSPSTGRPAFSSSGVLFVNQLMAQTKKAKIPIGSLSLPARAQELDFKAADRSYYVKFHLGGDPLIQIGQYLAARHQFDRSGKQPREYLDVRVQGKVFYR